MFGRSLPRAPGAYKHLVLLLAGHFPGGLPGSVEPCTSGSSPLLAPDGLLALRGQQSWPLLLMKIRLHRFIQPIFRTRGWELYFSFVRSFLSRLIRLRVNVQEV
jgi:hypothetical protein